MGIMGSRLRAVRSGVGVIEVVVEVRDLRKPTPKP